MMENLKTYETFQLELYEYYSLNEGFFENFENFMTKPFTKIVKYKLDKKTDDEKLDLLEKLLKGVNFVHTWKGLILTYSPIMILPAIKFLIPSIAKEEQIIYYIYLIIWVLIINLRFKCKTEVKNLINMVKDNYIRKKMEEIIIDKSIVDPFKEESWEKEIKLDDFGNRSEALLKDCYVYDIEITFNREYRIHNEQIFNILLWEILEFNIYNKNNLYKKIVDNRMIIKNLYIKIDESKKFEKECSKKLNQLSSSFRISNFEIIKK